MADSKNYVLSDQGTELKRFTTLGAAVTHANKIRLHQRRGIILDVQAKEGDTWLWHLKFDEDAWKLQAVAAA